MDTEPTFQSPCGPSAVFCTASQYYFTCNGVFLFCSNYVLDLLHQSSLWLKQFARMEALLSPGNIFHYSIPVSTVKPVESQHLISETPFMPPATRPTCPVEVPVAVEASVKPKTVTKTAESKDSHKDRKKSHKSRKSDLPTEKDTKPDKKADKNRIMDILLPVPVHIHQMLRIHSLNNFLMKMLTGQNPSPVQMMVSCQTLLKLCSKQRI